MKKNIYNTPLVEAVKIETMATFAVSGEKKEGIPAGNWESESDKEGLDKDENGNFFGE